VTTWLPLAVILCGTFIYVLDFFAVNVALPGITRSLHAGPAAVEWVVAGYGLSSACSWCSAAVSGTGSGGEPCS
jgi:MFS family permease